MTDRPHEPLPEIPPEPGSARAVRQGRISGRVVTVLVVSVALSVAVMAVSFFLS